jgi:excisionase family DNA binding protein
VNRKAPRPAIPDAVLKQPRPAPPDAVLLRPEEAAHALGIGRPKTYHLIATGELRSLKIGGSRRIPREAITEYVKHLQASQPAGRTA